MISISLAMIVKNEENVLARCLDSLKGIVDEYIIVDTGSTDKTKEIARRYTDKVYDFKWVDDFSAARNFAFSKCTCDYIYSADADEMLDDKGREAFMILKENMLPEIEIVQMLYVNSGEFNTTENYKVDMRPKLFKRLRTFTWIDPIHESVNLNPVVYDSEVEVLHMPESDHSKRDFSTFLKAIARGERLSDKLHMMYARELMLCGEVEDLSAAEAFFKASAMDELRAVDRQHEAFVVLARLYRFTGKTDLFFKYAMKNICANPCSDMCYELGMFYFDKGDTKEAAMWFDNAVNNTEAIINAKTAGELSLHMIDKCSYI